MNGRNAARLPGDFFPSSTDTDNRPQSPHPLPYIFQGLPTATYHTQQTLYPAGNHPPKWTRLFSFSTDTDNRPKSRFFCSCTFPGLPTGTYHKSNKPFRHSTRSPCCPTSPGTPFPLTFKTTFPPHSLPTWEPQVTIARNCRFQEVGTPRSQPRNHGLPL